MPIRLQSPRTAVRDDDEMSLHVLLLLLFHWHLPPPTVRDQVPEQKCWAQVSMDNPIQCRVGYFKKRDSLSS